MAPSTATVSLNRARDTVDVVAVSQVRELEDLDHVGAHVRAGQSQAVRQGHGAGAVGARGGYEHLQVQGAVEPVQEGLRGLRKRRGAA